MKDTAQLCFMRHRFFSPELGRFITEDFSHENGGLNLLRFMGNNPVNHIDPFGLEDPMISPKSSRGETYNRGPVNVGSLDISVTTADESLARYGRHIIVTDNGAHLAGGEVVYGEGLRRSGHAFALHHFPKVALRVRNLACGARRNRFPSAFPIPANQGRILD